VPRYFATATLVNIPLRPLQLATSSFQADVACWAHFGRSPLPEPTYVAGLETFHNNGWANLCRLDEPTIHRRMYSLAQNRRAPPVANAFVKPH
jgi:hypothetical protein